MLIIEEINSAKPDALALILICSCLIRLSSSFNLRFFSNASLVCSSILSISNNSESAREKFG